MREHIGLKLTESGRYAAESPDEVPTGVRTAFPALPFARFRGDEYGRAFQIGRAAQ